MALHHKLLIGIVTIISPLSSSNFLSNTTSIDIIPTPQPTSNPTFLYSSTDDSIPIDDPQEQDDENTMERFLNALIGPDRWLYTVSILSGIVIGLCLCAFLIYRHKTRSQITKSKSEPPEPFELALTLTGNSLGKKSKKHEIKVLPSLTPDNSAKHKQTLDTLDTPSPDDYGDDEMDFGKKVSKLTTKLSGSGGAGKRLKFQKVKSTDSQTAVSNTQRSHQYNNTANTNITGITNITNTTTTATLATMVIHGDMTEPPPNDQSIDDLNVDESDTEQSQNENEITNDNVDEDEDDENDDDDDDEDDEEMIDDNNDNEIDMDHLKSTEMRSGYASATGLTSEYEYENEWYEPSQLTDQGNEQPILKQCDSDLEISTTSVGTEDLRKQIEFKIQNKDKKQLKKLSQQLDIIKDEHLYEDSENISYNDNAMSEYPVSDYAMSQEYDMKSDHLDNITNDGHDNNNKTMIELDGDGHYEITINDDDGKIKNKKKTTKRDSPRNDMIIFGDDETTNYGMQQAENDTVSDNEEEEEENNDYDYNDDGQYQWLIHTLLRIDKKDGKKIINTFKENKVTDDRLKDLREQDWRDLIPQIGVRNELMKLHELEFPPSEGRGT